MKRLMTFLLAAVLTITAVTAGAYWSADSVTGGSAAAAGATVNQGATPTVSAVGQTITVTWAATTLSDGQAVGGYVVKRYDATTLVLQPMLSACAGTVTATSCVESAVPNGSWKYSITPVFATNWQGPQSAKSVTAETVTEHDQLGGVSAADTSGPTGGSVDASGLVGTDARYSTSTTLNLALAKGSDPSGLAATGHQLLRATATLTSGTCGSFGTYTLVGGGTDPASPKADTVADDACYSYQYVVLDTLGNATTFTSGPVKVDTTAPAAPSLAFGAVTNTYWAGSGTTVFYRSSAPSGSFTTTATASDAKSGIASFAFPTLGTNWTSSPGAVGVNTYSWSGAPAAPGTQTVTATNNATLISPSSPFTLVDDTSAPSAGTVSYADGPTASSTVTVTFAAGNDTGSGINTRVLQRASAVMTDGICGTYGGFTTVTGDTNPSSPLVNSVTAGSCYKYEYVVTDLVGNSHIATSTSVAKFHAGGHWTFDEGVGTSAADTSGNGRTATLQATASWTAGRIGTGALNLTGAANSFANAAGAAIDTSHSYSVAAWIKPNGTYTGHHTFASIDGGTISPFFLQTLNGQARFAVRGADSTSSVETVVLGGTITPGVWTHVAAVHDNIANTISIYVNGVWKATTAFTSPWQATGATTIGRAKWNGAHADLFNGAIDDVRMHAGTWTPAEIAALAAP